MGIMGRDFVRPRAVLAWPDAAAALGAAQPPGGTAGPGHSQSRRSIQAVRLPIFVLARLHPRQSSRGPRPGRAPGGRPGDVRTRPLEQELGLAHPGPVWAITGESIGRRGQAAEQASRAARPTRDAGRTDVEPGGVYESESPASD